MVGRNEILALKKTGYCGVQHRRVGVPSASVAINRHIAALQNQIKVVLDLHVSMGISAHFYDNPAIESAENLMVARFHTVRTSGGPQLSLVFFLVDNFIDAQKTNNREKEDAIKRVIEKHSWVYNSKVLVVLRDVAVRRGVLSHSGEAQDTVDISTYQTLTQLLGRFLDVNGDPELVQAPPSFGNDLLRLIGWVYGPAPLSSQSVRVSPELSSRTPGEPGRDSILFSTITKYLDAEVSDQPRAVIEDIKYQLTTQLYHSTIYSGKILDIVSSPTEGTHTSLREFLKSEYLTIRPKIVRAILNSNNGAALPVLFTTPQLSVDRDENLELNKALFDKISKCDRPTITDILVDTIFRSGDDRLGRPSFLSDIERGAVDVAVSNAMASSNCAPIDVSKLPGRLAQPEFEMAVRLGIAIKILESPVSPTRSRREAATQTCLDDIQNGETDQLASLYPRMSPLGKEVIFNLVIKKSQSFGCQSVTELIRFGLGLDYPRYDFLRNRVLPRPPELDQIDWLFENHRDDSDCRRQLIDFRNYWRIEMMKSGWDTLRTAQPDLDFIVESLIKFESLDPRYSDRCVFEGVYFIHPKKIVAQLEKKIADLAGKPEELGYHIMPIVLDSLLGTNIPLVDIFKLNDQWLG